MPSREKPRRHIHLHLLFVLFSDDHAVIDLESAVRRSAYEFFDILPALVKIRLAGTKVVFVVNQVDEQQDESVYWGTLVSVGTPLIHLECFSTQLPDDRHKGGQIAFHAWFYTRRQRAAVSDPFCHLHE